MSEVIFAGAAWGLLLWAVRQEKEAEYKEQFANPYEAAARGYVDEVIRPSDTRVKVIQALRMLRNKVDTLPKKKHGNIPL